MPAVWHTSRALLAYLNKRLVNNLPIDCSTTNRSSPLHCSVQLPCGVCIIFLPVPSNHYQSNPSPLRPRHPFPMKYGTPVQIMGKSHNCFVLAAGNGLLPLFECNRSPARRVGFLACRRGVLFTGHTIVSVKHGR